MADTKMGIKKDLWGPAFADEPFKDSALLTDLKEQAEALTKRTRGRVNGSVTKSSEQGYVRISLYAQVPALQNYMHKLLAVSHPIEADPDNPSPLQVINTFGVDSEKQLFGLQQFREWLEEVLSSDAAHKIIANLLRYSAEEAIS